nr:LysR family transcriptional regulator [uncultured Oscillibacter sp.]
MNYQSLHYFKMVAEMQHYTRAANALYITQPALSKAIRNLEIELGASLFEKSGRNVTLTQYGALFYKYVKRSLDEVDKGITAVRHMVELEYNTVFLSALFSMYAIYLPDKVMRFQQKNPACRFSMEYKYTTAILRDVLQGHSELGLCSDFETKGEFAPLEKRILYREPVGLIVGKSHPFASREKVRVEELRDQPFIVYIKSQLGTNKLISDLCAPYGFEPDIVAERYNDYGVIGTVASSNGIAIIPTSGFLNINSVVPVRLDVERPLTRQINLVWHGRRELPRMAATFRDALLQEARESGLSDDCAVC